MSETPPVPEETTDPDCIEESDGAQHRRYILRNDIKNRLDKYLCTRLPGLSRARLQKLINEGAVTVNGSVPRNSTVVRSGDVIDVVVPPPTIKQIPAEDIPIRVLYEDDHLILINKQPDLVVHPARSNLHGTLVNALAWYFKDARANGLEALSSLGIDEFRPGIVHRLDRDTTGVMVVAKSDTAHWRLNKQFEKRTVQKYYLALVHGRMTESGGVVNEPIGKHPTVTEAYAVRNDGTGRESVTLFRVRELYNGYSLVELELKTGRTHQIRVHLNWLGHPIIGDIIYGGEPIGPEALEHPPRAAGSQPFLTYARQKEEGVRIWDKLMAREDMLIQRPALHATVLEIRHPISEQTMRFTAPLYEDMAGVIRALRRGPHYEVLQAEGAEVDLGLLLS